MAKTVVMWILVIRVMFPDLGLIVYNTIQKKIFFLYFLALVEGLRYTEVMGIIDNVFQIAMTSYRYYPAVGVADVLIQCNNASTYKVLQKVCADVNHSYTTDPFIATININRRINHSVHFCPALQRLLYMKVNI